MGDFGGVIFFLHNKHSPSSVKVMKPAFLEVWNVTPSGLNEDASTTSSKWKVTFPLVPSKSKDRRFGRVLSSKKLSTFVASVAFTQPTPFVAMSSTASESSLMKLRREC